MYILDVVSQYWVTASVSFLITLVGCLVALKVFPKLGLVDRPHKYGLKRKPIPYYGGVVIYLAFVIGVLLFVPMSKPVLGLLLGGGLIALVGFFDDMYDLSAWIRLIFQFAGAGILVVAGIGVLSINLPILGVIDFTTVMAYGVPILGALFTVIWVVTILNAMNFLDGVGGLNSGVTFVAAMTLFALSIHPGLHENPSSQAGVASIALILAMVALAFLIFDFPKPKILMGDSGSTFLGFVLATLAIFSGGKVATAFLVLGIPLMDMVWVVLRRTFVEKKPFWKGDLRHMHHRLLDIGVKERGVVIMYLFVAAIFGSTAVGLVASEQKLFMIFALLVLMLLLAGALIFVPKKN
jgi:UDP-GlcNAc:undecaprenyl-phosphate/decaprenyl-phosphate GlcNAc-1-phosphate transferase